MSYPFPWDICFRLALSIPSGRRSLADDCKAMVERMQPAPIVEGDASIPGDGPLVIAANHFQRRGLWIGWSGAIITATIDLHRPSDHPVHWLVTGGLRFCQGTGRGCEVPGTRPMFRAVARTYQMSALALSGSRDRASALQEWLRQAEMGKVLGVFPEGVSGTSEGLIQPDPDFDRLCRLFARRNIPILPAGVFENHERVHVRFGTELIAGAMLRHEGGQNVMCAIASLVPQHLRGPYGTREHCGTLD